MEILIVISAIFSTLATVVIAWSSYQTKKITQQMYKLSKEVQDVQQKFNERMDDYRQENKKLFFAIVTSNLLTDLANLKDRFGKLMILFGGYKNIQKILNFSNSDFDNFFRKNGKSEIEDQLAKNDSTHGAK
jgi:Mlc titration factor MtfA (ptsG expression regulator)